MADLPSAAARVRAALVAAGATADIVLLPASARTAQEAAAACGCALGQIVKSLVFRGEAGLWLILVAGDNRVNERRLGAVLGDTLQRADPSVVREKTGFAIGGVAPLGHRMAIATVMDEALMRFETVWAAAGTPHAVFAISPTDLLRITRARRLPVA